MNKVQTMYRIASLNSFFNGRRFVGMCEAVKYARELKRQMPHQQFDVMRGGTLVFAADGFTKYLKRVNGM